MSTIHQARREIYLNRTNPVLALTTFIFLVGKRVIKSFIARLNSNGDKGFKEKYEVFYPFMIGRLSLEG